MMMAAAPRLLGSIPSLVHSHRAVVRINRTGCRCGLRQCCRHAATAHCCTAVVLLRLGPRQFCSRSEAGIAIVWQGRRRARQQPAEQRNEQQQTQKVAARDDASKISRRPPHIEVPTIPDIFVGGLLDVLPLAAADIGQSTVPCATTAPDTASCALLSRSNPASDAIASSAVGSAGKSTCRSRNYTTIATSCASNTSSADSAPTISAIHVCRMA